MEQLPIELVFQILFHLPYQGVVNLCQTQRRYYAILSDSQFWKEKARIDFEVDLTSTQHGTTSQQKYFYCLVDRGYPGSEQYLPLVEALHRAVAYSNPSSIAYFRKIGARSSNVQIYCAGLEGDLVRVGQIYRRMKVNIQYAYRGLIMSPYYEMIPSVMQIDRRPNKEETIPIDIISFGPLHVVDWLLNHRQLFNYIMTDYCLRLAARYDRSDLYQFLINGRGANHHWLFLGVTDVGDTSRFQALRDQYPISKKSFKLCLSQAAEHRHLELMNYLLENRGKPTRALIGAVRGNHLDLVQELVSRYPNARVDSALYAAMSVGSLDIVQYLWDQTYQRQIEVNVKLLQGVANSNPHPQVIEFIGEQQSVKRTKES